MGVARNADHQAVKQAFTEASLRWRDQPADGATAAYRLAEINEAWRVLRSPATRAHYDATLSISSRPNLRVGGGGVDIAAGVADLEQLPSGGESAGPAHEGPARRWRWLGAAVLAGIALIALGRCAASEEDRVAVETREAFAEGACVRWSDPEVPEEVDCTAEHDARVVRRVVFPQNCPPASRPALLEDGSTQLCLVAAE